MMITTLVALGMVSTLQIAPSHATESDFPGAAAYLTDAKVAEYREAAVRGNVELAVALSAYYDLWKDDSAEGEFWGRLAAEHGGCPELRRYHYRFLRAGQLSKDLDRKRAWLARRDKACESQ